MYDIRTLKGIEAEIAQRIRAHFEEFFRLHDYSTSNDSVINVVVTSHEDVNSLYTQPGMYLILTDYMADANKCTFEHSGLKAIYRGHGWFIRKRLMSHLQNTEYKRTDGEYRVCMKLDDKSGIDIDQPPYNEYRWRVIVHKMPSSSKLIREQAELAFDDVFGRPFASREQGR
jgi:hypothetical protein